MEDLTKTQLILLFILISIVVSFTSSIVTASLFEQAPNSSVVQTIQRVVEKTVGDIGDKGTADESSKETIRIVTDEQRIIEVVRNVSPAVVSIVASKDLPVMEQCYISPFGGDEFLNRAFPEFRIPQLCQKGTEKRQVSSGSGFVVRDDGLVVSNRHVVQDKDAEYTVIMNDGKKYAAKVLVRDPLQDIAILKVDGKNFSYIRLGESNSLQAGQRVIAIGNALGEFQNTVSVGVISGLRRSIVASGEELRSVIQTDAAINPGNSGGPLLNLDGQVIGINTAIAAGAENIGFALPSNLIKKDIEDLEKTGKIVYPFLGVRYQIIDETLQKEKNLQVSYGAYVSASGGESAVTPGSPAEAAGIKAGDVILEFSGEKIAQQTPLSELIAKHKVGETVSIKFLRDGKETTIQLVLTERKF